MQKLLYFFTNILQPKWVFPAMVVICLVLATSLRISGSSFGPYYDNYFNVDHKSTNLLAGNARGIRSDEWLVTTQLTIGQERVGYPLVNKNIGYGGKDMSIVSDAPYREWSIFFRPQNLAFFVLPLEYAFAFKWWFLLSLLLLSTYFLALYFMKNPLLASMTAVLCSFVPFIFWWYQSITLLSIAWAIFALLIALRISNPSPLTSFRRKERLMRIALSAILAYSLTAFLLLLYPAFQIPVVIATVLFFLGCWLNKRQLIPPDQRRVYYRQLLYIGSAALIALCFFVLFLITRPKIVDALLNTTYPGKRVVSSGLITKGELFSLSGIGQYALSQDSLTSSDIRNQSESSSFLILPFVFIVPLVILSYRKWRDKNLVDWTSILLIGGNALFAAHLFLPAFSYVSKIVGLHLVPLPRLLIGIGVLGIFSLVYVIYTLQHTESQKKNDPVMRGYAFGLVISYIIVSLIIYWYERELLGDPRVLVLISSGFAIGLGLVLNKYFTFGLSLMALVGTVSVLTIQPLYVGLGSVHNGVLVEKIRNISSPDSLWGVANEVTLENLPLLANRKSITGVQVYPDKEYWSKVSEADGIYNRYAHVLLSSDIIEPLVLLQPDLFIAKISCDNYISKTVTHILTTTEINLPCYTLIDTVKSNDKSFMFYKKH